MDRSARVWSDGRRRPWELAAAAAASVASIAIAACGSSAPKTVASYDTRVNAICASFDTKEAPLEDRVRSSSPAQQQADVLSQLLTAVEQENDQLKYVKAPASIVVPAGRALLLQDAETQDLKALIAALRSNDIAGAKAALESTETASGPADRAFDAVGASTCGSGSSPAGG